MDTVQRLRKRAHEAGNLKSTEQQKVIASGTVIRVAKPANPAVVYVAVSMDPWWVYGALVVAGLSPYAVLP
jgi:hypothetical protein